MSEVLPNEIIALILRKALECPTPMDRTRRERFGELRRVSKRWLNTALSTPELWRALEVTMESRDSGLEELRHTERWFERGGGSEGPYSLILKGWKSIAPTTLDRVVSLLAHYRWQELGLYSLPDEAVDSLTKSEISSTHLKRMALESIDLEQLEMSFKSFPSLFSILYSSVTFQPSSIFHHSSITYIHLQCCVSQDSSTFALLLSSGNLPSLEEIILERCGRPSQHSSSTSLTASSKLTRVVLIGSDSIFTVNNITFPGLQFLRLASVRFNGDAGRKKATRDLLQHSAARLEVLSLEDSKIDAPEIADLVNIASQVSSSLYSLLVPAWTFFSNLASAKKTRLQHLRTLVIINSLRDQDHLKPMQQYFAIRGTAGWNFPHLTILTSTKSRSTTTSITAANLFSIGRVSNISIQEVNLKGHPAFDYPIGGHRYDPLSHEMAREVRPRRWNDDSDNYISSGSDFGYDSYDDHDYRDFDSDYSY